MVDIKTLGGVRAGIRVVFKSVPSDPYSYHEILQHTDSIDDSGTW